MRINLLHVWQQYRKALGGLRASANLLHVIDDLFERPVCSIGRAQHILGITHRAATQNMAKLVDAGILQEVPGRKSPRLFIARDIINVIEEPVAKLFSDAQK